MSHFDYSTLATRVCSRSQQIAALLMSRAYIDHRFAEPISFHSTWPPAPTDAISLTVAEQQQCTDALDQLDAELENLCRGGGAAGSKKLDLSSQQHPGANNCKPAATNKPLQHRSNSTMSRQQSLKRSGMITSSRENLSSMLPVEPLFSPPSSGSKSSEDSLLVADAAQPIVVTADEIRSFNASAPTQNINAELPDVQALCDQDKQTFRPIFKLLPKLREFTAQIQRLTSINGADSGGDGRADDVRRMEHESMQTMGVLLKRLHEVRGIVERLKFSVFYSILILFLLQLIVDLNYLDEHPYLYDVNDVAPIDDDPVESCLEELYKQIMNQ